MGLSDLTVLFESVSDAGFLPPASDVLQYYNDIVTSPLDAIVARVKSNAMFFQFAPTVGVVISDMTNQEIANALIPYLEIYYPDMIQAIAESPESATKVGAVLNAVLNDIRGA